MSMDLKIDPGKCVRCGMCVEDCNPRALELDPATRLPRWIPGEGEKRCFKCQHCLAICPAGALSIGGVDPARAAEKGPFPDGAAMLNLIQCRRSCRNYRRGNVDRDTLDKLKNMLAWTPTGVNDHRLFFGFIDDAAVMEKFRRKFLDRLLRFIESGAPEAERFSRYRKRLLAGEDVIFRGAPYGFGLHSGGCSVRRCGSRHRTELF